MLQALLGYAQSRGIVGEPGFGGRRVHWAIHVDGGGLFLRLEDLRERRQGRLFEGAPKLSHSLLTAGRGDEARCHFLAETVDILLEPLPSERVRRQRAFFMNLLSRASEGAPDLAVARRFLADDERVGLAYAAFLEAGGRPTDSLVVVVDGRNPLVDDAWKPWWRTFFASLSGPDSAPSAIDLVDGRPVVPLATHPKISGLAPMGGASTGDCLVSFARASFGSYGFRVSANAAMSAASAALVVESAQHLLRRSHAFGGTAIVCWLDAGEGDPIASLFMHGAEVPEMAGRYHLLVLSGNSGRVRVRSYREGCAASLGLRIEKWRNDLAMNDATTPTLGEIFGSLQRDPDSTTRGCLAGPLLNAILDDAPVPESLVVSALTSAASGWSRGEDPPVPCVALLTAFVRRRGLHLNLDLRDPAYLFGRLLAALARAQYFALGDVGAGPVQRAMPLALISPERALLLLRGGARRYARSSRVVGDLAAALEAIPPRWSREEQALIVLGYSAQRWEGV